MKLSYDYGFDAAACVLCIICLIFSASKKRVKSVTQHQVYLGMVINVMIGSAADMGSLVIEQQFGGRPYPLMNALTMIYFAFHLLFGALYVYYIMCANGSGIRWKKRTHVFYLLPLAVGIALIFINLATGMIYYYDSTGYHRSSWILAFYIIALIYAAGGIVNVIRYRSVTPDRVFQVIVASTAVVITGIIIQAIVSKLVLELITEAIALLVILRWAESDESNFDQLTQLQNENALFVRIRQLMYRKIEFRSVCVQLTNLSFYYRLLSSDEYFSLTTDVYNWIVANFSMKNVRIYTCHHDRIVINVIDPTGDKSSRITDMLEERMKQPWSVGKREIYLKARIMPLQIPEDFNSPEELSEVIEGSGELRGRDVTVLGSAEIAAIKHSIGIEKCIERVLANNGIEVYYQPIWNSETKSICACEALMRIYDSELGFVPPSSIVPLAEQNGTIRDIDRIVLESVCAFIRDYQPQKYGIRYIEVNLSMYEMLSQGLAESFSDIANKYGVPVSMLNIEFTETCSNEQAKIFEGTKKKLSQEGFRFSLDDFGTEYSNMGRLFNNDFMNIKLDKSLLWESGSDENTRTMLASLTRMIRQMGCNALQEGVETREQLEFVTSNGCNLVQGYYFSKPLPAEKFLRYTADFNGHQYDDRIGGR